MSGKQTPEDISERGSALLASLAILATLAVTMTGVLIFGGWQRAQGLTCLEEVRVRGLAESGIHQAIAELTSDSYHQPCQHHIVFDSTNSISYIIRPWGAYLRIQSTGIGRRITRTLTADVGILPPDIYNHVLSPIGAPLPLVIAGSTRIRGDIYVSSGGIIACELNGQGYRGTRLVEGSIDTLNPLDLPSFDNTVLEEFLDSLDVMESGVPETDYSLIFHDKTDFIGQSVNEAVGFRTRASIEFDIQDGSTIETTQYFFAGHTIYILGKSHLSNCVLSSKKVVISHQATLDHCVVVADHVQLTDESKFGGQIVAIDTVRITGKASLTSPTLILLRGRRIDESILGAVEISSRGSLWSIIVNGVSSAIGGTNSQAAAACRLHVSDNSSLYGLLWWEGLVEIEGTFQGAAAVNSFSHFIQPTTYMNWLVDADLRYLEVAASAAFPVVFEDRTRPRVGTMIGNMSL